jgi:hypothetical protein
MTMLEILARFEAVKQGAPQEWAARGRAHEDHAPSLTIRETADRALLHCHAGCSQEAAVTAAGLTMTDLFFNAPTSKRTPRLVGPRPGLTLEAFARAKGFTVDFLQAHGVVQNGTGLDITYRLRDGSLAVRQRARTALAAKDGSHWTGPKGAPLVPYGLEDLDAAKDKGELWLAEGETDRLTACWHGLPCLGLPGASMAKLLTAEHLAGIERLFIVQEPGDGGTAFILGVAARLVELQWTGDARVVRLPAKDLNELHLKFGEAFAPELARALAASAPLPAPDQPEEEASGPKVLIGGAISTAVLTETRWLVEGLFSEPDQHLIVGSSSGAKTWLLADLCLAVSHSSILTYLGQPVRRHGRVCLESWEQGQPEDLRRLHKLARGHALPIASAFDSLILLSETPGTLNDESYFTKRLRELIEWGVILYAVDSLSEAAGIELNDNTAYTEWRRARIQPILAAGITDDAPHRPRQARRGAHPRSRRPQRHPDPRPLEQHRRRAPARRRRNQLQAPPQQAPQQPRPAAGPPRARRDHGRPVRRTPPHRRCPGRPSRHQGSPRPAPAPGPRSQTA